MPNKRLYEYSSDSDDEELRRSPPKKPKKTAKSAKYVESSGEESSDSEPLQQSGPRPGPFVGPDGVERPHTSAAATAAAQRPQKPTPRAPRKEGRPELVEGERICGLVFGRRMA